MAAPVTPIDDPASLPHDRLATDSKDTVIEVVEERVHVEKRLVETGRARVHVTVEEHDEPIEALLMRQDLVIERVPVGTRIDAVPAVRRDGDTVVIPVVEEIVFVEKRLVLKEELHIRIDVTRQVETQTVRLRREHAEVEHDGPSVQAPPPYQETCHERHHGFQPRFDPAR